MAEAPEPIVAPGWAAIDRAAGRICPAQTPHQFTSRRAYDLDGNSPLPAITVWEGQRPDHWMYVTYGLSELFDKSSARPDVSGFGYELVFRLPRSPGQDAPPAWPLPLLQGIGHYVLSGHGTLDSGHVVDLGGPLRPESAGEGSSALRGVVCVPDPRLGKIETPHGTLLFLALLGIAEDEVATLETWDLERKVGLLSELAPAAVTEPDRGPFADDPETAPILRRYATKIMI
jgi:hypothetical protein